MLTLYFIFYITITGLIEHLDNSLKESDISNIQECYLMGNFNVNFLRGNKILLENQYYNS